MKCQSVTPLYPQYHSQHECRFPKGHTGAHVCQSCPKVWLDAELLAEGVSYDDLAALGVFIEEVPQEV